MKAGEASYRFLQSHEHVIRSEAVAEVFRIKVLQPVSHAQGGGGLPVLYATDSDELFGGLATLANALQGSGETPPFILVGIGYERSRLADLLRLRDFLTPSIRSRIHRVVESIADSMGETGVNDLREMTQASNAHEFQQFIVSELMPFINGHYPTLPDNSGYFGYSAGATFGLYTLFSRPGTFAHYILGSPSTSYDGHHFGIDLARAFLATGQNLSADVFISVGELEEFRRGAEKFDLVSGYYRMVEYLTEAAIPGLKLTARVFPGETHATAWSPAFSHGLKCIFGFRDPDRA